MTGIFSAFARFSRLLVLAFLCAAIVLAAPAAEAARSHSNPRYAAIVIDADTGQILSESNADKRLHPASLAKMMTLLMTFDALRNGTLRLQDYVRISNRAASMSPSKLGLPPGSAIRVEDAIYALVTKSANDIAVAMAEKIGGTESHFAAMMTSRAQQLGMRNTQFKNASGLHNPQQLTSARDMAVLARVLINDYPQYYHYFSTRQFSYRGYTHHNHNRLMDSYRGMDGLKTGFIQPSGFNLVASAKRDGRRLIGVVFGGRTANSRNAQMRTLLDGGFKQTRSYAVALARRDAPLPTRKPDTPLRLAGLKIPGAATGVVGTSVTPSESAHSDRALIARADSMLEGREFRAMIGEGDLDPSVSTRLETGLLAIAALRESRGLGKSVPGARGVKTPTVDPISMLGDLWTVQIGAYASRARTDQALQGALKTLPPQLADASPVIVPLKTRDGWLFRGRLGGFTKAEAILACSVLPNCMPVAPQAY